MKAFVLAALLVAPLCAADFETAASAYRQNDYTTAFELFMELAQQGDARSQTVVAMMYKYGEAVPQNHSTAFEWYQKAARQGYAPAQFNVGDMYRTGTGVEQDISRAIEWLKRAAQQGYTRANDSLVAINVEPVSSAVASDPLVPWSKSWNFRLPNTVRFAEAPDALPLSNAGGYRVQLGAMETRAAADRLWDYLANGHPDLFRDIEPVILLTEREQQTLYRVQTSPFEDLDAARQFCRQLQSRGIDTGCLTLSH